MERVLLHTCCAPCSLSCIDPLRSEGIEPVAFWYNPNIHPWKEYQARRDCLLAYAPTIGMEVRVQEDYGLKDFVRHVAGDIDFRSNFRAGNQRARELGFYMQKYCGCVFSEADRYQKQIDRDRAKFDAEEAARQGCRASLRCAKKSCTAAAAQVCVGL